jgi:hypothetical protein
MRMRIATAVTFGMLSVLAACSSSTDPEMLSKALDYEALVAEAVCPTEEIASTADWQVLARGGFRYRVPPDFRQVQVQGIDSYVGHWASSQLRFASYDYGWYSNPLHGAKGALTGYSACRDTIGGQPVALLFGWDSAGTWWHSGGPKYVVAGSWRNVLPGQEPAMHLTMTAASDRAEDRPILLAILRSVEFIP